MCNIEIWHPVFGYEELYEISTLGSVRRLTKAKQYPIGFVMKQSQEHCGYMYIELSDNGKRKKHKVHRLLAFSFFGQPPTPKHTEVNHTNGIKTNNYLSNLEWVTSSQNKKHAYALGLASQQGERHATHKLTEKDVLQIREERRIGSATSKQLAARYGVVPEHINAIVAKRFWKHI